MGTQCPAGSWCDITPVQASWLGCLPTGSRAPGQACADDPWSCAEGTHCVGLVRADLSVAESSWSVCAKPCGGAYTKELGPCAPDEECRYLAAGRGYCMPTGALEVGDACRAAPHDCPSGTHCLPGADGSAKCLVPCLPGVTCPEGTACETTSAGPLLFCRPPGFEVDAWWEPPW